jgi:predicted RNA-binding Zn-ribbon protein involved in translation (DUF1610 family)
MSNIHFDCPHCDTRSAIRTSQRMTRTMREITYVCTDPECGHTFIVTAEATRTLSPSAKPNPSVLLPISQVVRERLMKQLELLPAQ